MKFKMIPNISRSEFIPILWNYLKCKKLLFEISASKVFFPFHPCPAMCIHLTGMKFSHMLAYTLLNLWRMRHLVPLSCCCKKVLITHRWGYQFCFLLVLGVSFLYPSWSWKASHWRTYVCKSSYRLSSREKIAARSTTHQPRLRSREVLASGRAGGDTRSLSLRRRMPNMQIYIKKQIFFDTSM